MDREEAAERTTERTLVVGAALDLIARPVAVAELASGIRGSELVEVDEAAHGVPVTRPETINALLRKHLVAAEATIRT